MMKIYTKTGDGGMTGLQGGKRISKTDQRIIAYGTIDEANAALGISLSHKMDSDMTNILTLIQNNLFVVGADLSNPDMNNDSNRVSQHMIDCMEKDMDKFEEMLTPLTNFILPGGSPLTAHLHHARTIVRRAEIQVAILMKSETINPLCLVYLNRLSDMLFVLGRLANKRAGNNDVIWKC